MKKNWIAVFVIVGVIIVFFALATKEIKKEPITITENSSLRELTIDAKIKEAELIVIGEVKTTLPSKWKKHNEKDTEKAKPQEIYDAGGLFTDSRISIEQILKGDYKESMVRVRSFIGETAQVRWVNSSESILNKGKIYLLFLEADTGPTAEVDTGDYISVNANTAVYEIIDGKAISADDEWVLEELIAYIEKSLSSDVVSPIETPTTLDLSTETPLPSAEIATETPLPAETSTVTSQ